MKKLFCCLICFCMLFLTACGNKFPYPYEDMKEKTIKVEIVNITYIDSSDSKSDFIKELTENEMDNFLKTLSNMKLTYPFPGGPLPLDGYVFVIYYNDNSYEKIAERGNEIFNETDERTGRFNRRFTGDDFNELLSKFVEVNN